MPNFPTAYEASDLIVEIGKRMYNKNLVASNDGNISCKISPDIIITTPTGVSKGFMEPDMMVKMSLDGRILPGGEYKPSSEVKMHLRVYKENPEVMAVAHAHPPVATSFAIAGIGLDQPILTETILSLGSVPVAKYATPGSEEVPDSIAPFCVKYNAVLLANHGALTWGNSLMQAYFRMESVEYYATIMMYTENILCKSNKLSCEQIAPLLETRKQLGISGGGIPACSVCAMNTNDVMPATGPIDAFVCRKDSSKQLCCAADARPDYQGSQKDMQAIVEQATREILEKLKK